MSNTEKGEQEDAGQEETHLYSVGEKFAVIDEKRWLWRMPDIVPVGLQDILHSGKSDLRKSKMI